MPDDASRERSDSPEPREPGDGAERPASAPWDESMLGSAGGAPDDRETDDGERPGDENTGGNVAGEFRPSENIEPGTPSLENSLFVVFGAYVAVLGLTRLFIDVQGFDAQDLLVLTGGTLLVGLVLFGFFGVLTPDS